MDLKDGHIMTKHQAYLLILTNMIDQELILDQMEDSLDHQDIHYNHFQNILKMDHMYYTIQLLHLGHRGMREYLVLHHYLIVKMEIN